MMFSNGSTTRMQLNREDRIWIGQSQWAGQTPEV